LKTIDERSAVPVAGTVATGVFDEYRGLLKGVPDKTFAELSIIELVPVAAVPGVPSKR
jgi:hypothetical protein